jgi:hypothetical protein
VDQWRNLPESAWGVTPETARLLKHWRQYSFSDVRPFFCQIEAVETAIWLTEVAPHATAATKKLLGEIERASRNSNPDLFRIAFEVGHGCWQNDRDGDDNRLANGQCRPQSRQQDIYARLSSCHAGIND